MFGSNRSTFKWFSTSSSNEVNRYLVFIWQTGGRGPAGGRKENGKKEKLQKYKQLIIIKIDE